MTHQPAGLPTARSRVTLSRIMTAVDVNLYGTVHGGVLIRREHRLARRAAIHRARAEHA